MMSAECPIIIEAVMLGQKEDLIRLIEAGYNVNEKTDTDNCAIFEAVRRNDCDMVKILIKAGAKVDVVDGLGRTPIEFANHQKFTAVQAILENALKQDALKSKTSSALAP